MLGFLFIASIVCESLWRGVPSVTKSRKLKQKLNIAGLLFLFFYVPNASLLWWKIGIIFGDKSAPTFIILHILVVLFNSQRTWWYLESNSVWQYESWLFAHIVLWYWQGVMKKALTSLKVYRSGFTWPQDMPVFETTDHFVPQCSSSRRNRELPHRCLFLYSARCLCHSGKCPNRDRPCCLNVEYSQLFLTSRKVILQQNSYALACFAFRVSACVCGVEEELDAFFNYSGPSWLSSYAFLISFLFTVVFSL